MFGASTPTFGAASTSLFSPSTPSAFGGASANAAATGFGSPLATAGFKAPGALGQTPNLFGAAGAAPSTTPSFGALGAASTPAFGTGGLGMFNTASKPTSTFGTLGGISPQPGTATGTTTFPSLGGAGLGLGFGAQQQTPQLQQQQQQQVAHLGRKDRHPVTYSTKLEDLDDPSRHLLQELEKKVKQHREHKRQLDGFERLQVGSSNQKSRSLKDELDMEVHMLSKKVQGLLSLLKADKQSLDGLYQICMKLVRRTEALSNASQRLKLRATTMQQMQAGNHAAGLMSLPGDLAFRPPSTPSPFLVEALANFEHSLGQMSVVVAELEQLHLQGGLKSAAGSNGSKAGQWAPSQSKDTRGLIVHSGSKGVEMDKSMSKILDNFVVYFNHVLAQYSQVHLKLQKVKKNFNASLKQQGVDRDFFVEADRKAVAAEERLKKEAEQKKQQAFAANSNPQAQAQQQTPPASALQPQPQQAVPQLGFGAPTTAFTTGASLTPGLFSTPTQQKAPAQSTSLFSPSTFGAAAPATPTFGVSPTPTTPGLFGAAPVGAFGSTAPMGGAFGAPSGGGKKKSNSKRGK